MRAPLLLIALTLSPAAWLAASELPAGLAARWTTAVDKGFAHLARRQLANGSYNGEAGAWTGLVAAVVLAHLSHGHTGSHRTYGAEVGAAIGFLLRSRKPDGQIYSGGIAPIYQQGLCVLALSEAFGEFPDQNLRPSIEAGVDLICRYQNQRGGWRHLISRQDGDELPSSVLQFMALRAAKNAGFAVPESTISQGLEYVKLSQRRLEAGGDGGFVYSYPSGESNWSRTGAGIACLTMGGAYRDSGIPEGIDYLAGFEPMGAKQFEQKDWWMFGAWFATIAFHQASRMGARENALWEVFYPKMVEAVIARQREDGGWGGNSDPFDTAAALIVLGFRLNYLPIHQL